MIVSATSIFKIVLLLEVFLITFTILFEVFFNDLQVGILHIQSYFGPKCIVPRFMKTAPYNYYIEVTEENKDKFNIECIICLDSLINNTVQLIDTAVNNDINMIHQGDYFENDRKTNCRRYFKKNLEIVINYFKYSNFPYPHMITPCNHLFHSDCLERWIEKKLECPFCRTKLPPLE